MQARNEIVYYLLDHPLKEERIAVFNKEKIVEALKQQKEGLRIRRVLHVFQKEADQEDKLMYADKLLINEYHNARKQSISLAFFLFFAGLAIVYLLFRSLFRIGYLPLVSFLTRNFKTLTPEIVNFYSDLGAQLTAPILGFVLALSPIIIAGIVIQKEIKKAREFKNYEKLMASLKKCELAEIEDESFSSFCKDSKDLTRGSREQTENLRNSKSNNAIIESCRKIRDHLEKLGNLAKFHKLDYVNEYYQHLQLSLYSLENYLKKPKFWRNDERYVKKTLRDLGITYPVSYIGQKRKIGTLKSVRGPIILKVIVGIILLLGAILCSGLYTISENQAAIVVEYDFNEVFNEPFIELIKGNLTNFRADLIATLNHERSGGNTRIIDYNDSSILPLLTHSGKLYWHLPAPFGKHHKIDFEIHEFHLKVPLIFTVATDYEGRSLMYITLTSDVDGNPSTEDIGFRSISAQDLFDVQFNPEKKLAVMMLDIKGRFTISSLEDYALWVKNSYGKMDERIKQYGFYGEIAGDPRGDKLIEAYLSSILNTYIWQERYPMIFLKGQIKYPELSPEALESAVAKFMVDSPQTLTDGFVEALVSEDFIQRIGVDLERGAGIDVLEGITTHIYEDFL